jgi:hypothetical protein
MPEFTYRNIIDLDEFLDAAKAYTDLGWAVMEQLHDLANGVPEAGELNDNAVSLIERFVENDLPKWVDAGPLLDNIAAYREQNEEDR